MLRKFLAAAASTAALMTSVALAQTSSPSHFDALTYRAPAYALPASDTAPVLAAQPSPTATAQPAQSAAVAQPGVQSAPTPTAQLAPASTDAPQSAASGATFADAAPTRAPQSAAAYRQSDPMGGGGGGDTWRAGIYGRAYVGATIGGQAELEATGTTGTGPIFAAASEDDFELGWQAGYAIGFENVPLRNWRLELEGFYSATETDDGVDLDDEILDDDELDFQQADVTLYGGFVNALYDFDYSPFAGWRPFAGAGIGYGRLEVEYQGAEAEDEVFLWQLMAGAGYDFGDGRSLEVSYRYLNADSADFDADDGVNFNVNGDVEVDQHALLVAYRYRWFR